MRGTQWHSAQFSGILLECYLTLFENPRLSQSFEAMTRIMDVLSKTTPIM
jgi:hypothetical protein